MRYISTRGKSTAPNYEETLLEGLAADGGLFLPESIPTVTKAELKEMANGNYRDTALKILSLFALELEDVLPGILNDGYSRFRNPDIIPVKKFDGLSVAELFHGPTFAFKDLALQYLGAITEYLLKKNNRRLNILGATSGDTGSAAIHGFLGKENVTVTILHPHERVSPVQRRQMTTVTEAGVYNIALRGSFDDCQGLVKEIMGEGDLKARHAIGAVNSINWGRISAQIVYYFHTYLDLCPNADKEVSFAVPTGNFGNIFAGYLAKRMGLPIKKLILASNANDILTRFVATGDYSTDTVVPTLSPSMDILAASNFERYLFYLYGEDPQKTAEKINSFISEGRLSFSNEEMDRVKDEFVAASANDDEILETIKNFHSETGEIVDPHTACAVKAVKSLEIEEPVIVLATAHPAKFGDALTKIGLLESSMPKELAIEKEEHFTVLPAEKNAVLDFLEERVWS